ncbi:MAG: glycosyl transferase, partial [Candidatus Omnitrophica bacterium CG07_land_8_20_14_0_80_50_8]
MRILIIKLGAMGDVLRTTPLLPALRKKYPGSKITWLVEARCRGVLEKNPFI